MVSFGIRLDRVRDFRQTRPDGRIHRCPHRLKPSRLRRSRSSSPVRLCPKPRPSKSMRSNTSRRGRSSNRRRHELDELLKDVPGVQLFRRSDLRSGHPTSQGLTLRALGGNASSRALLVLDGVPQSDPFGGWINWPAYDPADLSGIRVVRGGGSVANGPGALAGTIEMLEPLGRRGGWRGRCREPRLLSTSERVSGSPLPVETSPCPDGRPRSDGFVPITQATRGPATSRAPYRQWSSRARWVAPLGPLDRAASERLRVSRLADLRDRVQHRPDQRGGRIASVGRSRRVAMERAWLLAVAQPAAAAPQASAPGEPSPPECCFRTPCRRAASAAVSKFVRPCRQGFELRIGADGRRTTGETRELSNYSAGQPTRRRRAGGETFTSGLFAEGSADLHGVTLSGGARIDHWQISDGHLFEQTIATAAVIRDDH